MAKLKTRRKVLLAKIESSYNSDPTPTEGVAKISDPYQSLTMPASASGSCDYTNFSATDSVTLMPESRNFGKGCSS